MNRFGLLRSTTRVVVIVPHQVVLAGGSAAPDEKMIGERFVADLEDIPPHAARGELLELRAAPKDDQPRTFLLCQVMQVRRVWTEGGDPDTPTVSLGLAPVEFSLTPDRLREWLAERGFRKL